MRIQGWWQSIILILIAASVRLAELGRPHAVVFDETYYVKDGISLWRFGYEKKSVENANELLLQGDPNFFLADASYVVHPPFGKWVIGLGVQLFGQTPWAWRIMVALLGIAAVVLVHRIARRLFAHELTAFLAGLFMAIDGMAIVHSRTALLDQTLMFFVVFAFYAVVRDRDGHRVAMQSGRMRLSWRPWLVVASVSLGLAIATKWSAVWFVLVLGLLVVFWNARNRIRVGQSAPWLRAWTHDALPYLPVVIVLLGSVYLLSWTGWLVSDDAWGRQWALENPTEGVSWLPEAFRSLWHYHQTAWSFHVGLTSEHSYQSNPWSWPLMGRPTSFFYESSGLGSDGCEHDSCSQEVLALGNPLIWWAGTLALIHQLWRFISKREMRSLAIVLLFLAGWMPWLLYQERTIFSFYAIVMLPFMVLALAASIGQFLGSANAGRQRTWRSLAVGSFVILVIAFSIFYLPLWTGEVIPYSYWQLHMWLPSWI